MTKELLNIMIIHDLRTQLYQQRVISDVTLLILIAISGLLCVVGGIEAMLDGCRVVSIVDFVLVGINGVNSVWIIAKMIKRRRAYKEEVVDFEECRNNLLELIELEQEGQKVVIEDGENEN